MELIFLQRRCRSRFAGGCPYPGIEGREIANKLKNGYRMPKPKHIDQNL